MDLLSQLWDGDTLVVWRLDRLGRSLPHLLQTVEDLAARGVGFKSLTEAIDTITSRGKLIFSYLRRTRRIRTQPDPRTH
ncbi:recombinase family protein, partial [Streptomyces sp. NPDC002130]